MRWYLFIHSFMQKMCMYEILCFFGTFCIKICQIELRLSKLRFFLYLNLNSVTGILLKLTYLFLFFLFFWLFGILKLNYVNKLISLNVVVLIFCNHQIVVKKRCWKNDVIPIVANTWHHINTWPQRHLRFRTYRYFFGKNPFSWHPLCKYLNHIPLLL